MVHSVPSQSWLMLATGDSRVRGSEYDDSPSGHYSWDSTVPRSADPQAGHGVVLSDGKALLGVSVIQNIDIGQADKDINKCPTCGSGRLKLRKKEKPRFRCDKCNTTFATPATRVETVTTYRADYEAGWVDLAGRLTGDELRALTDKPKSQHAIRGVDLARLLDAVGRPRMRPLEAALDQWLSKGGHRTRVTRVRVGQPAFRQALIARFGNVCAFTGPGPLEALQAAHLYSFAKSGKHDPYGGWLMRSDLHNLFDVGHIAVHPDTLTIDVISPTRTFPVYDALHGQSLKIAVDARCRSWLEAHWKANR